MTPKEALIAIITEIDAATSRHLKYVPEEKVEMYDSPPEWDTLEGIRDIAQAAIRGPSQDENYVCSTCSCERDDGITEGCTDPNGCGHPNRPLGIGGR